MTLEGRVSIVTGSGSGIGRAIAAGLAADGAQVAVLDLNQAGAEETVELIRAAGGTARAWQVDITDEAGIDRVRDEVESAFGRANVIVNNAGWDEIRPFMDNDRDFIRKVVAINYLGPVTVTQAFLRGMIDAGAGGRVVSIASDAGRVGSTGETVYAGAKGGIIGFTKSLAREMARHQVTVNCVCPGPTDTPLFHQQPEKMREALIRAIPFRRLGQPADIAHAVRFFASDGASFITGQVLSVSGGLTMAG
ncbi:MAG TPA: 2-hydroxycyclohexanecarboxyl-CoA dehydrogenase [Arthrobacter bacterium]|jgi:NAD(P)-dependent dehydrogenase (short-subunit alcohol dehydrogenase family)|nr:2-hydroxycyclohexanecarboxyl-CoA dehydrogenase [Arthrobacter sp.]